MSPLLRAPGAAGALTLLALAVATSASADPLASFGSYVGQDHAHHDHHGEVLREINLSDADLTDANFSGAQMRDALLVGATAVDARFPNALLRGANLSGADLTGADLSHASLKESTFANAVLRDASLVGCELKDADFRGAHLIGANLGGAVNGSSVLWSGAYYDAHTVMPAGVDSSEMLLVAGACPANPEQYWIDDDRDGHGDRCDGVSQLPEPGAAALLAGAMLLAVLRRRS